MEGTIVLILIVAFLPALIPLFSGRIGAAFGVALLCLLSFVGLTFFIVPGVVLWFAALIVGVWSANNASRDRQHAEMMRALSVQPLQSFDSEASKYVTPYKPAFSTRTEWEANIYGERRRFPTRPEALAYASSKLPRGSSPPQVVATPLPEYKGIPYQVLADYRVSASGQSFESVEAFRRWVDAMPT